MGERDAFGNEKEENPLAGMGWDSHATPKATPDPAGTPPPPVIAPPRSGGRRPPSPGLELSRALLSSISTTTRTASLFIRIVLPLTFLLVMGTVVVSVVHDVSGTVSDVRRSIHGRTTTFPAPPALPGATPEAPGKPVTPPSGVAKGSLLRKSNFTTALRSLKGEGSRVRTLRVAADRIDASIVTATGREKEVQVTWQGELRRLSTSPPGFSRAGTFRLDVLQRGAPFRLARSAAGRAKRAPGSIDYLVASTFAPSTQPTWSAFLKNGAGAYAGDARGRIVHKIG